MKRAHDEASSAKRPRIDNSPSHSEAEAEFWDSLNVSLLSGACAKLNVDFFGTVRSLKDALAATHDLHHHQVKIVFGDRVLQNDAMTLQQCNLAAGDTVMMLSMPVEVAFDPLYQAAGVRLSSGTFTFVSSVPWDVVTCALYDQRIRTLNLRKVLFNIDEERVIFAIQKLGQSSTLTALNLSGNMLGEQVGLAIANSVETSRTITCLKLSGNLLDAAGQAIAIALEGNTSLTSLNLSNNALGVETLIAIARTLERNTAVKSLILSSNEFASSVGTTKRYLPERLDDKPMIRYEYIDDSLRMISYQNLKSYAIIRSETLDNDLLEGMSGIYFREAKDIAALDRSNFAHLGTRVVGKLSDGWLEVHNEFRFHAREIAQKFAKAMAANATLTSLDLSNNNLCDEWGYAIAKALETNKTILFLDLDRSIITQKVGRAWKPRNPTSLRFLDS